MRKAAAPGIAVLVVCAAAAFTPIRFAAGRDEADPMIRVAVASSQQSVAVTATGAWRVYDGTGTVLLFRPAAQDSWTFVNEGTRLSGSSRSGFSMAPRPGGVLLRPVDPGAVLAVLGKRYRGELAVVPAREGSTVINRLGLESYLRGVVPLEIGDRRNTEMAAVKAQAVAARSYAYTKMRLRERASFDLVGTVSDQAYGGIDAERPLTDAAIADTRGMMVVYGGLSIDAPYHSNCGGATASVREVWHRQTDRAYLRHLSDRIPGSDRFYCDISPRFSWSRTLEAGALDALVERHLSTYVSGIRGPLGRVRSVSESGRTASGRLSAISIGTENGTHIVRGDDIRFVLRTSSGEILPSTNVNVRREAAGDGRLARIVMSGRGNGHGVGMCQWGAIGRARAGHGWQAILSAYYPGTSVETIY